jgi:predicted nuclease of predicted toxin-antitoxin system
VKFLVDAQLPPRLARFLIDAGHDCVHTSELPAGNRTTDEQIAEQADIEWRIVVTKDRDFRDSHLLRASPRYLLLVATGNITNNEPLTLVKDNLALISETFGQERFVEITATTLVVHRQPREQKRSGPPEPGDGER